MLDPITLFVLDKAVTTGTNCWVVRADRIIAVSEAPALDYRGNGDSLVHSVVTVEGVGPLKCMNSYKRLCEELWPGITGPAAAAD